MRKETLLLPKIKLLNDAPFYAWDCISLSISGKWDIYLIIKNEKVMSDFLKLLIFKTETMNGLRGSAISFKKKLHKLALKNDSIDQLNNFEKLKVCKKIDFKLMKKVFSRY